MWHEWKCVFSASGHYFVTCRAAPRHFDQSTRSSPLSLLKGESDNTSRSTKWDISSGNCPGNCQESSRNTFAHSWHKIGHLSKSTPCITPDYAACRCSNLSLGLRLPQVQILGSSCNYPRKSLHSDQVPWSSSFDFKGRLQRTDVRRRKKNAFCP